jgi:hypothetical protein
MMGIKMEPEVIDVQRPRMGLVVLLLTASTAVWSMTALSVVQAMVA